MLKRISIIFIISLLIVFSVNTVAARSPQAYPDIVFNGTRATCSVEIQADRSTDTISATMELWQGNKLIDDWSGSGTWLLIMEKNAIVQRDKTYTLIVNYSINGIQKTPASTTQTNN